MSAKLTFFILKDLQSRIPSIEGTRPVCYWLSFLSSPGSQGGQVLLLVSGPRGCDPRRRSPSEAPQVRRVEPHPACSLLPGQDALTLLAPQAWPGCDMGPEPRRALAGYLRSPL